MQTIDYHPLIARLAGVSVQQVNATIRLFDDGCTTPFIARYRKEMTNMLDEVRIEQIRLLKIKYSELVKRKEYILETIREQGKLTEPLEKSIVECWEPNLT